MTSSDIPELSGDAALARDFDGGHIQIIASAGSGKTETVAQRVARLVADGVDPQEMVAFTFTTRAAEELKARIRERVEARAGVEVADKLGTMYVGTIHGYCFQLLSEHIGIYESYEVMDENQLSAFVLRYATRLNVKQFSPKNGTFDGIARLLENIQIVENELLDWEEMPDDFAAAAKNLYQLLDEHRLLTYGLQIDRALKELEKPDVHESVTSGLKHLIVDEYQDVNPAQERLISMLATPTGKANLVVVGDDDQAIYQWRGSTVQNITTFTERYENVTQFQLLTNRRSRPQIVQLANTFSASIPGRLDKAMAPSREENGPAVDIIDNHDFEIDEARDIAEIIQKLRTQGFKYRDMAILVRGKVAYPAIMQALADYGIPLQPGDRTGLFDQADADFLGRVFSWFIGNDWKVGQYGTAFEPVTIDDIKLRALQLYGCSDDAIRALVSKLNDVKASVEKVDSRRVSLVDLVYTLLGILGVRDWDFTDELLTSRLGTIARFADFVADYEVVTKHARMSSEEEARQIGAADQREWYYKNFAIHMSNYARGAYTDFEGEDDLLSDSVELMTIHAAKGLEWPIVFLPSLTSKRFPSSRNGQVKNWIVPRDKFDAARYEGTDADERRLFYVATTRAREWLSLSAHDRVNKQKGTVSPYLKEVKDNHVHALDLPPAWTDSNDVDGDEMLQITYSEIAAYLSCGLSYRLRHRIGFPPAIVEEIGYGKAVHHLMRAIAEERSRINRDLKPAEVDRILATDFFLPFAGRALSDNLRASARRLVFTYMANHAADLERVWQIERKFELVVNGALISGRADVILDKHEGKPDNLAIVDYKTSTGEQEFDLQLQIYTEAGLREGLEVRGAFVHDLAENSRAEVDTSETARTAAIELVEKAVDGIKKKEFEAKPEVWKCARCDVRAICRSAASK
jgi:DNA helicase-2/ATP-dependent DNA helicase PcrA